MKNDNRVINNNDYEYLFWGGSPKCILKMTRGFNATYIKKVMKCDEFLRSNGFEYYNSILEGSWSWVYLPINNEPVCYFITSFLLPFNGRPTWYFLSLQLNCGFIISFDSLKIFAEHVREERAYITCSKDILEKTSFSMLNIPNIDFAEIEQNCNNNDSNILLNSILVYNPAIAKNGLKLVSSTPQLYVISEMQNHSNYHSNIRRPKKILKNKSNSPHLIEIIKLMEMFIRYVWNAGRHKF